ncbi:MAG: hypoxanthine phosphoribosyltransferase [Bdellovibrionales bacterium]|nr:hypoxanthine phosphoribosyltransferase [Bdellovibrionales bacterium]
MLKGLVPFLKAQEIQEIIKNLAQEIKKDYSDTTELILICPLRGPLFFFSDLIRQLQKPVQVDFVLIESTGEGSFRIKKDISLDIKGRDVLIVEEIIDSGLSLAFLKERLKLSQPTSLKTVVLLDKSSHRKTFIPADYRGRHIDDRFIVGYGMDLNEEGRNYPDMYHLGQ